MDEERLVQVDGVGAGEIVRLLRSQPLVSHAFGHLTGNELRRRGAFVGRPDRAEAPRLQIDDVVAEGVRKEEGAVQQSLRLQEGGIVADRCRAALMGGGDAAPLPDH